MRRIDQGPDTGCLLAIVGVIVVAFVGLVVLVLSVRTRRSTSEPSSKQAAKPKATQPAGKGGNAPADSEDDVPSLPPLLFEGRIVLRDVDADEIEDIVAVVEAGDRQSALAALSGKNFSLLWKTDAFAGYDLVTAAAGPTIAAADERAVLHFFDARTGEPRGTAKLSDKPRSACSGPASEGLIDVSDRTLVLVEGGAKPTAAPTPSRPEWCPKGDCFDRLAGSATCNDADFGGPKLTDAWLQILLRDRDAAVLVGAHSPGTLYPRFGGVDPATDKVLCQVDVPSDDDKLESTLEHSANSADLRGGLAVVLYEVGDIGQAKARVAAFDPKTCEKKWDVKLGGRPDFGQTALGRKHAFFVFDRTLFVLDRKNGAVVARLGGR